MKGLDVSATLAYVRRHHVALLALFVALGGTAWAGSQIKSGDIAKNAVRSKHIKRNQVKTADLKDGGITSTDLGVGVVDTAQLAPNAATGDKVQESTLGKVPAAASADTASNAANAENAAKLEGAALGEVAMGRSSRNATGCFPGANYADCGSVQINVPRPHRLLMIASGDVFTSTGGTDTDTAACRLEVDNQPHASEHQAGLGLQNATGSFFPTMGFANTEISGQLPAGNHQVDLACKAVAGQPGVMDVEISVVAIGTA